VTRLWTLAFYYMYSMILSFRFVFPLMGYRPDFLYQCLCVLCTSLFSVTTIYYVMDGCLYRYLLFYHDVITRIQSQACIRPREATGKTYRTISWWRLMTLSVLCDELDRDNDRATSSRRIVWMVGLLLWEFTLIQSLQNVDQHARASWCDKSTAVWVRMDYWCIKIRLICYVICGGLSGQPKLPGHWGKKSSMEDHISNIER